MARPAGAPNKDKPFRDALRLELAALDEDDPKTLRRLARRLLESATKDDGLSAIKEVADRLDGKPAQAVTVAGDEDGAPIKLELSETEAARRIAFTLAKGAKSAG